MTRRQRDPVNAIYILARKDSSMLFLMFSVQQLSRHQMISALAEQSTSSGAQDNTEALEVSRGHSVHTVAGRARPVTLSLALLAGELGAGAVVLLSITGYFNDLPTNAIESSDQLTVP